MSFGSYSTTPSSNISCNGVNIDENCPAANVNNVIRQLMADGRELYDTVAAISVSSYMPLTGGAFSGNVIQSGAGPYIYHANAAFTTGVLYVLQQAATQPTSPAEGTILLTYA